MSVVSVTTRDRLIGERIPWQNHRPFAGKARAVGELYRFDRFAAPTALRDNRWRGSLSYWKRTPFSARACSSDIGTKWGQSTRFRVKNQKQKPRFLRGFLRADDGTRTHDLLHGKRVGHAAARLPCAAQPCGFPPRLARRIVLSDNRRFQEISGDLGTRTPLVPNQTGEVALGLDPVPPNPRNKN